MPVKKVPIKKSVVKSKGLEIKNPRPMQEIKKNINDISPDYFTTITPFSKIISIILFISLPFIGFALGYRMKMDNVYHYNLQKKTHMQQVPTKYETMPQPVEMTLETAMNDFSSSTIAVGDTTVHLLLTGKNVQPMVFDQDMPFVCETKDLNGIKGDFKITAVDQVGSTNVIDEFDLNEQMYVPDEPGIEQRPIFSKLLNLTADSTFQGVVLAYRSSCDDEAIYVYSFDPKTQKVVQIPFYKKDGTYEYHAWNPMGNAIPQIDANNNLISSQKKAGTNMRTKVRYKFNQTLFRYEEIETYVQL